MMCSELTISVIVPVYEGGASFARCLSALSKLEPTPHEIIVVTDGDAGTDAQLAEACGARVLSTRIRSGPARARNLGAGEARGDVLFFVDADVLVCPDAIAQIRFALGQDPGLAAVFGSYDDAPAAANFLSQYKNLFHHYVHQVAREEASTFWGACGAIRRGVFLALGGFDERYRQPSVEDIELGYRLKRAGHRIRLCKTLQVKHLKRWGVVSLLSTDFGRRALPWTELILRDRQFVDDLNLRHANRASVMLVYGLLLTLVGAWWWPGFSILAVVWLLLLLALNMPLYRFFRRERGLYFTLQSIPWHWLYYFYSGLAFAIGIARHSLGQPRLSADGGKVSSNMGPGSQR